MQTASKAIPALSILLLAVIGVLPWGQSQELRFCLPALAFLGIHFWQGAHAHLVPTGFVALVGLAIDVVTSGPLGYWPLVFLAALTLTWGVDRLAGTSVGLSRWLGFIVASIGLSGAAWLVASLYFVHPVEWRPMLVSVFVQSIAYPLIAIILRPLEAVVTGPRPLSLERPR